MSKSLRRRKRSNSYFPKITFFEHFTPEELSGSFIFVKSKQGERTPDTQLMSKPGNIKLIWQIKELNQLYRGEKAQLILEVAWDFYQAKKEHSYLYKEDKYSGSNWLKGISLANFRQQALNHSFSPARYFKGTQKDYLKFKRLYSK